MLVRILWTSEGKIGRWKLTKVEKRTFGGACWGGCMHNQGCKNEGTLLFYIELSILCIGDRLLLTV